ncbi:magnesium chelatase subunit D family protein [Rugosimonospora africana]|nr:magnesium chelatase subunit D family protein [Rugosimonospora africana]
MDDLSLALLVNAVSPAIGGVLVRGEKGTAKSTMVRALAGLLPEVDAVAGCRFGCDPAAPEPGCPDGPHDPATPALRRRAALVELPVGATEDRLVGALDLQRALTEGVKAYEPGLLAAAHRGVLYVDEVNLLPDHLVDLLLDAAAMGRAYVERDGVSVRHPARFLLVGTMNPEEGELRPQLLDRFGLAVDVAAPRDPGQRAEVVRRRLAYDADPQGFGERWAGTEGELAGRIAEARSRLSTVELPDAELRRIARVCASFEVDGMRADIVVARTATALAAWWDRPAVTEADVRDAVRLALPHRRRRDPFDAPGLSEEALDQAMRDAAEPDGNPDDDPHGPGPGGGPDTGGPDTGGPDTSGPDTNGPNTGGPETSGPDTGTAQDRDTGTAQDDRGQDDRGQDDRGPDDSARDERGQGDSAKNGRPGGAGTRVSAADSPYRARLLSVPGAGTGSPQGRRSTAYTRNGRIVGARPPGPHATGLHLAATLLAAAPHQAARGRADRLVLRPEDLRAAVRKGREANLVLFVVDASGSMAARQRMRAVKGAVLSLLRDAYQRRDKVGLITFRGERAEVALPPTGSHDIGAARLRELPTGGRTPLAAGLTTAARLLASARLRDPHRRPLLILVTDGRSTAGPDPASVAPALSGTASVVVDCESGPVRLGLASRLAGALSARYLRLDELSADGLRAVATGTTTGRAA